VEEHEQEIYARYGLAMSLAQTLEFAIVNALIAFKLVPQVIDTVTSASERDQLFDAFMEQQFEKTLGKLVTAIRVIAPLPDHVISALKETNRKRNWLAHRFFRERTEAFMNEPGRQQMLMELHQIRDLFESTTQSFEQAVQPAYDRLGLNEESQRRFWGEYAKKRHDDPTE
jgi:hypothetical protein